MVKIMKKLFLGGISSLLLAGGIYLNTVDIHAAEITGTEGIFTHIHGEECYEEVLLSCDSLHTRTVTVEKQIMNCQTCNGGTSHHLVVYTWTCPKQEVSWQMDCYSACDICGTYHSRWSNGIPGDHHYTARQLSCSLMEGEQTAIVKIVADDAWTNGNLELTATCNMLKQDLSSDNITLSWENGKLLATENGTYTVTATNSAGVTVTSMIEIANIDKIAPVIEMLSGNEDTMTEHKIDVSVSAQDKESGLAEAAFSWDGGVTWTSETVFGIETGKNVTLAVRDKAGNISYATVSRGQFPYPKKTEVHKEAVTMPPAGESVTGGEVAEGKAGEEIKLQPQEKKVAQKAEEAAAARLDEQEQKQKQKQAYGISLIFQKEARDKFFSAGALRKSALKKVKDGVQEKAESKSEQVNDDIIKEQGAEAETVQTLGASMLKRGGIWLGAGLCVSSAGGFLYLFWLHSAVLYCYEGGEEYRKIGLFHIKKGKKELELYLPEYVLQSTKAFRYRLMLRNRLVKKCADHDLVVYNEDNKLRQQVEECVDFVL